MTEILFALALLVLTIALNLIAKNIKRQSKEIDKIKARLGRHHAYFLYLDSRELDNEKKIDQLEKVLELKEYFDKEKEVRNEND